MSKTCPCVPSIAWSRTPASSSWHGEFLRGRSRGRTVYFPLREACRTIVWRLPEMATPLIPVPPARAWEVLVVDDEKNIRATLTLCLEGMGCKVTAVSSAEGAVTALGRQAFDLAFLDLRLGEANGLDLLPRLLAEAPDLAVVVITAYATFDTAVEAIKRGAVDYVPKPFTPAQIRHALDRIEERRRLTAHISTLEAALAEAAPEVDLGTASPRMRAALATIERAAASEAA